MQIGEYVHYHYTNYLNYGLEHAKDGEGRKPNPNEALQAQKKQLLQTLHDRKRKEKIAIKKDLENKLNFFFPKNGTYINFGFTREQAEVLQDLIRRIFEQAVSIKGTSINYNTLGVYSGNSSVSLSNKKYMNIQREGQKYTNFGAIKRRINTINTLRAELNARISSNSYKPADKIMLDRINRISKKMEEFEKDYSDSKASKRYAYTEENISWISEMQSILDSSKQKVSQDIQGLVGEYIPAITEEVLREAIAAGVTNSLSDLKKWAQNFTIGKDILSNKVVGNVRSNKVIPENTIIRQKKFAGQDVATLHDIKLESSWTQDKVDIILTLPGDEKINASVKNVHLNNNTWIHILSGTSLLKMLVDYPEFANHYLNITADLGRGRRGPDQRPSASLIKNAHDSIKLTIGLHSLAGGLWADKGGGNIGKTDTAELFVVNNANIGKYQVYFISDMMKALYQDIDLLKIQDFGRVGWTNIYKEDFRHGDAPNYKNAYARIAMILMQLHKQHLEVSVSSKILG